MKNFKIALLAAAIMPCMISCGNTSTKAGVDLANLDTSVSPKEDFYQYACGGWMKANPLTGQYSRYGVFDALGENNREQVKELFEELATKNFEPGTIGQKVSDLYTLGMDSVRLNKEGNTPILEDLAKIQSMNRKDLSKMIAWQHASIGSPFFGSGVDADLMDSDVNAMYISEPGVGLGDRDYYLEQDDKSKQIRSAYITYLEKLFTLSGYDESSAKQAAQNVMNIETEFAKVKWTREALRDYSKQYNLYPIDKLKKEYANIDWDAYFEGIGITNIDKVILTQPDVLARVNAMVKSLSDQEIKDYLAFEYLRSAAGYLDDNFVNNNFEMFGKTLQGKEELTPRWKRALDVPNGMLGEAVGQLYVEKYFPAESKEKMLALVNNLKEALGEHIRDNSWMSDSTKVNALNKLDKFTVKIGYPDKWKDYSNINIDPEKSYWANVKEAIEFKAAENYSKYGKPVDRDEWLMSPQTVNAYYNPTTNEICFPAGILQAPFFDPNADDASNYGAIGVVIGHEMTHGFDDQGRNFDAAGNMKDWWKPEDAEKFNSLADILVAQFDSIIVAGDTHANGRFTLGENIADHGGLNISYSAFLKTNQGKGNTKIDGFTPAQRFFLSYANVWAGNIREEEILRRTKTDPHSLGKWRVNASLRNIPAFYEAFDIQEGDAMWLAPEKRVTIW